MEAMEGAGLTWKVEAFGVLWNARVAGDAILGSCLMAAEMANGLRRTNAIVTDVSNALFGWLLLQDYVVGDEELQSR